MLAWQDQYSIDFLCTTCEYFNSGWKFISKFQLMRWRFTIGRTGLHLIIANFQLYYPTFQKLYKILAQLKFFRSVFKQRWAVFRNQREQNMPLHQLAVAIIMFHIIHAKIQWLAHCRLAKGLANLSWAQQGLTPNCEFHYSGNSKLPGAGLFLDGD